MPRPSLRAYGKSVWRKSDQAPPHQDFKNEIREYTRTITRELLEVGGELNGKLSPQDIEGATVCPLCKKGIIRITEKAAGCSGYASGCKFVIWRTMSEKKLSEEQIMTLIEKGKTEVIKGFKSKAGGWRIFLCFPRDLSLR